LDKDKHWLCNDGFVSHFPFRNSLSAVCTICSVHDLQCARSAVCTICTMSLPTPFAPLDNYPPGIQQNIYVNGFCFCFHHGEEYCYPCTYDFRALNNMTIQDDLEEIIGERLSDVREFLLLTSRYRFMDVVHRIVSL